METRSHARAHVLRALSLPRACALVALLAVPRAHAQQSAPPRRLFSTGEGGCFLARDARVYCWGSNYRGLLGSTDPPRRAGAAPVPGVEGVTQLAVATDHACALGNDRRVFCWGDNGYGQLGFGRIPRSAYPPRAVAPGVVANLTDVAQLTVAEGVTCVRSTAGAVRCFGANWMLGVDGSGNGGRTTPTEPRGLVGVQALYAQGLALFASLGDGSVRAWGNGNDYGQLGGRVGTRVGVPTVIAGLTNVSAMSYTAGLVCVVHGDGGVSCWGDNEFDVLGPGRDARCVVLGSDAPRPPVRCRTRPQRIAGITDATDVTLNGAAIIVRRRDGSLLSWGLNEQGDLLDVSAPARHAPAPVTSVSNVDEISAIYGAGVCIRQGERVACQHPTTHRFEPVAGLP